MRRVKKRQAKNCTICKSEGVKRAGVWRRDGFWSKAYCEEHKHLIHECHDNGYMSEADYEIERRFGI